jgi:hypothetical protein
MKDVSIVMGNFGFEMKSVTVTEEEEECLCCGDVTQTTNERFEFIAK